MTGAGYILLRLPMEIKTLFKDWLAEAVPHRATRVMRLMREARGGRDYDPTFGQRQVGTGAFAELIAQRFRLACERHHLSRESKPLDTSQFRAPPMAGDQLALL